MTILKNFSVTSTAGKYLGTVRGKDQESAMKTAIAIYGNYFGKDPGVTVEVVA